MMKTNKIIIEGENLRMFNSVLNKIPHEYGKMIDIILTNCMRDTSIKEQKIESEKGN